LQWRKLRFELCENSQTANSLLFEKTAWFEVSRLTAWSFQKIVIAKRWDTELKVELISQNCIRKEFVSKNEQTLYLNEKKISLTTLINKDTEKKNINYTAF
jgi:hypothetical protein